MQRVNPLSLDSLVPGWVAPKAENKTPSSKKAAPRPNTFDSDLQRLFSLNRSYAQATRRVAKDTPGCETNGNCR